MASIYIVEDDENIREIEEFALKNAGFAVRGFDCAASLYRGLGQGTPELILLDVMLPDEDGLTIIRKLRGKKETARVPVIMVTAKSTELDKVKGLDLGADDYVTKPFGIMEMISRVKAVMRRSYQEEENTVLQVGPIRLEDGRRAVYARQSVPEHTVPGGTDAKETGCAGIKGSPCELTYKEYELLKLLMLHCGSVVSREAIINEVWGSDYIGESRTLDMHIKTLRKKLGDAGSMIRTVRGVGYILREEET